MLTNKKDQVVVLVAGNPATGKTTSLSTLPEPKKVLYLNSEKGKDLPFIQSPDNEFKMVMIDHPNALSQIIAMLHDKSVQEKYDTVVIDSLTMYGELIEATTMKELKGFDKWTHYSDELNSVSNLIGRFDELPFNWIITGHNAVTEDSQGNNTQVKLNLKGSVGKVGFEKNFNLVVHTVKKKLEELVAEGYVSENNPYLHITEEDEEMGFKYCYQVLPDPGSVATAIRCIRGVFSPKQRFIDADINQYMEVIRLYKNGLTKEEVESKFRG